MKELRPTHIHILAADAESRTRVADGHVPDRVYDALASVEAAFPAFAEELWGRCR